MDIALSLLLILILSFYFFVRFELNASVAPFFVISLIAVGMSLFAMADLLVLGGWMVAALSVLGTMDLVRTRHISVCKARAFVSPGIVFFVAASVFFALLLSYKQAAFRAWDEYSFWGFAAKIVFQQDRLYTLFESSIPNNSYQPALPIFSYFVQFFANTFSEWKVYLAYDIMIAAVMAMLFSNLKWKHIGSILILSAFGLVGIYGFKLAMEGLQAYATAYSDMQTGFIFAGTLLIWFHAGERRRVRTIASVASLVLLVMTKDVGFALALVAAAVYAMDLLLSQDIAAVKLRTDREKKWGVPLCTLALGVLLFPISRIASLFLFAVTALLLFAASRWQCNPRLDRFKDLFVRAVILLLPFLTILFFYRLWAMHFAAVTELSRDPHFRVSALDALTGKSTYFNLVLSMMIKEFFERQLINFAPIYKMCALLTLLPVVAAFFTDKRRALRLVSFSLILLGGFLAYYVLLAYLYTTQFPIEEVPSLLSFNRYVSTYPIGWLFAAVGILFADAALPRVKIPRFAYAALVTAGILSANFAFSKDHIDQVLLTSSKISIAPEGPRIALRGQVRKYIGALSMEDRIYFASDVTGGGGEWFIANYELQPAFVVDQIGTFVEPGTESKKYDVGFTKEDFAAYLAEDDIDFVFVFAANDYFYSEMGPLFLDGLGGVYDGSCLLYHVDRNEDDMQLIPVANELHLREIKGMDQEIG